MIDQEKSVWEQTFDFNQAEVQGQILTALKLLFQNISEQFYNNPLLHSFDTFASPAVVYDMKNLTSALFSDPNTTGPSTDSSFWTIFLFLVAKVISLSSQVAVVPMVLFTSWLVNLWTFQHIILQDVIETVFFALVALPATPVLATFFGSLYFLRKCISFYFRIEALFSQRGKRSLLSAVDGFWAYETYASCSACTGLYIIEGPCDPEKVWERIKKTIMSDLVGGKMNQKLGSFLGFPCWEQLDVDRMDMRDYIKVVLNTKGRINNDNDVFQVMRDAQDRPIVNRAPWEVYLIPNYRYSQNNNSPTKDDESTQPTSNTKYYAAIFRIHHSIMDGISTANVLHSAMADKPFKFSIDPVFQMGLKKRIKTHIKTSITFVLGFLTVPRVTFRNLTLVDNYNNRFCSPGPQLTGPKTFTWSKPVRMDVLKKIKNVTNTSFFCILISALGGAYRQLYLKNGKIPESEFFHSMSPVALLPYPDRKPQNRFTGILVPVSVGGKNLTPLQRLHLNYTNLKTVGSTSSNINAVANWYYPWMLGMMPYFMHKVLSPLMHLKMSMSNVPGPAEEVTIFEGGNIKDMAIWLPIKLSIGLGMGFFSYGNRGRATLIGDKVYFPNESDVKFIMNAFENELTSLAKAAEVDLGDKGNSVFMPEE